jgi:hypothetical protein
LILLLGLFQFLSYLRANDFWLDATYFELANSILQKGRYLFDFSPETLYPPGFPLMLALIGRFAGLTQAVALHTMAISNTLALMATYELLRRTENRAFGACTCLLLGTTSPIFNYATRVVLSDVPYFAASSLTLLSALKLGLEGRPENRIRTAVLSGLLVLSLMIRSAGIALLLGCCVWLGTSFFAAPALGRRRLRILLLPIVLGIVAQFTWAHWASARQVIEWPVRGWPQPYTAQVMIKSGNEPDLGEAHLADFPGRVWRNLVSYTAEFVQLMEQKYINPFWSSPAVSGVAALLILGLCTSLWPSGGELYDWYFVCYSAMYLLWPWEVEERFVLPMVPLAALYAWRGLRACLRLSRKHPVRTGLCFMLCGLLLTAGSARFAIQDWMTHQRWAWQPLLATGFWSILTAAGGALLSDSIRTRAILLLNSPGSLASERLLSGVRFLGALAVCVSVSRGITADTNMAWANLHFDMAKQPNYAEIEADRWIAQNEPASGVVMARRKDLAFHYSGRRVVWFPPTANASVLMNGILKYHVGLIVVVDRPMDSYWRPADQISFHALQAAYPSMFRLVHQGPGNRVFEVLANRKAT